MQLNGIITSIANVLDFVINKIAIRLNAYGDIEIIIDGETKALSAREHRTAVAVGSRMSRESECQRTALSAVEQIVARFVSGARVKRQGCVMVGGE